MARTTDSVDISRLPPAEVIFGRSPMMAAAREKLRRVADAMVPVLLQGESGTGKEIFARLLHANGRRANFPWIKVNCPAIPHPLVESELFGYEKGAFTGAYARKQGRVELSHMGTLFLDEVGSLDLTVQAKLLQVLQDGAFTRVGGQESRSIDTRLISASRDNLRQQTIDGTFRQDLFFRINTVTIELPALRQRIEDLPMLIDYFFEVHSKAFQCNPKRLSREILRLMQNYDWPGNIRELENMIRSHILIGSEEALAADLVPSASSRVTAEIDLAHPVSLKEVTRAATQDLERQIILKVLQANGWSRLKTAKWLNISYRSLLYKLQDPQVGGILGNASKAKTALRVASLPQASIEEEGFESRPVGSSAN